MRYASRIILLMCVALLLPWNIGATACPFCLAPQRTFSEEVESSDVVVIATLIEKAVQDETSEDDDELEGFTDYKKSKFRIAEVIKGGKELGKKKVFEYLYFGDEKKGSKFLIMGMKAPHLIWTSPISMTDKSISYLKKAITLPKKGPERLAFFQDYLENKDDALARDAYDEFAKAPYDVVKKVSKKLNHDQLVKWLNDSSIPASRRRLYFTLLGVCGTEKDIAMLEGFINSKDRLKKSGMDALLACYLTLHGSEGLDLLDKKIFANKKSDYSKDLYPAIMALRFIGTETKDIVPKKRLLQSMRLLLVRPDVADLVIPDLARWEDWTVVDQLEKLFKKSDPKVSWVRIPIINYLKVCPNKDAKEALVVLEKFDPESFKRAKTFFDAEETAKDDATGDKKGKKEAAKSKALKTESKKTIKKTSQKTNKTEEETTKETTPPINPNSSSNNSGQRFWTVGVPLMLSVVLFGVYWVILRQPTTAVE